MNKKAQIWDIMFLLFTIVSVALCMIFSAYIYYAIKPQINTVSLANNQSIEAYNKFSVAFDIYDNSMIFIVIGLTITLLITSFLIPTHPAFMFINIFGFIVLVVIAAIFTNMYYELGDVNPDLQNITQNVYPKTSNIMYYLPTFCAAIVALSTIVMYSKGR